MKKMSFYKLVFLGILSSVSLSGCELFSKLSKVIGSSVDGTTSGSSISRGTSTDDSTSSDIGTSADSSTSSHTGTSADSSTSSDIGTSVDTSTSSDTTTSTDTSGGEVEDNNPLKTFTKIVTKKQGKDFKILNLTDIQLHDGASTDVAFSVIDQLVKKENPDMITFLGDLLNDHRTNKSVINSKAVIDKIDGLNIPWAPIFGNHDYEDYQAGYESAKTTTSDDLVNYYTQASNCLFTLGPTNVSGKSNYIVNVVEEGTKNLVESLYFMDSRLSGLDDSHAVFYRDAVNYSKELNDGNPVDSVIFTHIALPEYGDAIEYSKSIEYHDLVGCFGRNPCDLASGTRALFPVIKELGVTDLVVCGHDHENAYYNEYDGVRLAYSMKSSDGDGYDNTAAIGGSVVSIGGENEDFYYSKADIGFSITDEKSFQLDALSYWRYSGAKFAFDVELPTTGSIRFSLLGTNFMRGNIAEKERCGAWNRLTSNINIDAATKTANFGALTQISGNKYRYELDLTAVDLNKNSGEVAYGDETLRLAYFSNANAKFKVSNMGYEFEKVTETNQVDLANAVITGVVDKASQKGLPVKQDVTVTLNEKTLKAVDDILVKYENNIEVGTATLTVVPSGKGAHNYKGSVSTTFEITGNQNRGVQFEKGYSRDLEEMSLSEILRFDIKFTSTGDATMWFMLGDGWDQYFGYYGVKSDGTLVDPYKGVTVTSVEDGYVRVTCVLSQLNKQNGGTPNPTEKVNLFFIHNSWGGEPTGYIDFDLGDAPAVLRGQAFSAGQDVSKSFEKMSKSETIVIDFKFTSDNSTHINFMLGNSADGWSHYNGYYRLNGNGTMDSNYNGIVISTTSDGYIRLTIKLGELDKCPSGTTSPSDELGYNLFYIRGAWSDATGYVDLNPSI